MRAVAALALSLTAAAALAGCATNNSNAGTGGSGSDSGPITLTANVWSDWTFVQAAADAYKKKHPNVTVQLNAIPDGTYFNKIPSLFKSSDTPDFSAIPNDATFGPEYVKAGVLADLSSVWSSSGLDSKALPGVSKAFTSSDGKRYTIPAGGTAVPLIYYSKALFKKAGISDPSTTGMTMDQFYGMTDKLKAAGVAPLTAGLGDVPTAFRMFLPYFSNACGTTWVGKIQSGDATGWSDPCVKDGLSIVQQWKSKGVFAGGNAVTTTSSAIADSTFEGGKTAMLMEGSWAASAIRKAMASGDLGWFLPPSATSTPMKPTLSLVDSFGASANSKHLAATKDFLAFLADYSGMWQHGIVPRSDIPATAAADQITQDVAKIISSGDYYPDLGQTTSNGTQTAVNSAVNSVVIGSASPAGAAATVSSAAK